MKKSRDEKKNLAGPTVRRLRKSNDWTQKEFAKLLREAGWKRCTRGWVSRLEAGDVILRDIDLPYLCAVLGEDFGFEFMVTVSKAASTKTSQKSAHKDVARLLNFIPSILLTSAWV